MSDQASRPPTELRATATLMQLEAGTYAVFGAAGTPVPNVQTGLPAVRLSVAPGADAGRVAIVGFDGEGWLSGREDAALIRVRGGPAQVMVTVYQGADTGQDAPRIQVLRLSEARPDPAAPPPQPIEAMAHLFGRGDVGGRFGDWIGERGSRRWIEGFALQSLRLTVPSELEYQAVLGRGWLSPWLEAGQFCGSRGMSLPVLGLHVRLRGAAAEAFDVAVTATFLDGTSVGPVTDVPCETPSLAPLEAFQVVLQPRAAPAAAPGKRR
ncbi:MAG: hypothetical protein RQ966_04085 [Acetobacteraceae bacterium]|nr:hypothetical protein [Acetobacteraceae bacterium]